MLSVRADACLSKSAIGKVIILIRELVRAGSTQQAYLLSRALKQKHDIAAEVWALCGDRKDSIFEQEFQAAGVPARVIGFQRPSTAPRRSVRALRWGAECLRVVRRLRTADVDVLLPVGPWPNVVAGLTYRLAGVRLCVWGERHAGGERVDPIPEGLALRQYRRFVANSTVGVEFLSHELRIPRERISLIPSAVEPQKIAMDTAWRSRLRLKPTELLVVMIGNLTHGYRDLPTLLRAWAKVQQNWTSGERPLLALAGSRAYYDSSYQEGLEIRHKENLDSSVRFLDFVADAPGLIQAADLAVFSSRLEGMPNGILECMSAGKPVVATDLPGVRDALGSTSGEVLVPPANPDLLARALLQLLHSKTKRDVFGEANRARARLEFTVEHMTQSYVNLIVHSLRTSLGSTKTAFPSSSTGTVA